MDLEKTPEHELVTRCLSAGVTIAVAESCSGGLIAHRITNVPGASDVFRGGAVAYANEVKTQLLGVPTDTLAVHGAVSEPVALAMARGARRVFKGEYSVAVTGIAGPSGGTAEKPVGTVYIAVAGPLEARARLCCFEGDRAAVKAQTADAALAFLLERVEAV